MHRIQVKVLQQPGDVAALASLTASITQHPINDMDELLERFEGYQRKPAAGTIKFCQKAKHGTTQRHGSYTIAIVGASRRFLAQIRTHHVGLDWVSGSLQYQDVSDTAKFVVPYPVYEKCRTIGSSDPMYRYLDMCQMTLDNYRETTDDYDNDTGGYVMCQAVRNTLILTGNAEALCNLINRRLCNRNTVETQYVTALIWQELMKTYNGELMFGYAGPDCMHGPCREGKMCCGHVIHPCDPEYLIKSKWPLLFNEEDK